MGTLQLELKVCLGRGAERHPGLLHHRNVGRFADSWQAAWHLWPPP